MLEYPINQAALVHVRLVDPVAAPVPGVGYADITLTIEKANGTVVNVPVTSDMWTEVTTGAFTGKAKYDLTIPSAHLNVLGPLVWAVSGGVTQDGVGSVMGIIHVVDATFTATDRTTLSVIKARTDELPADPASNTHIDGVIAQLTGYRPVPTPTVGANGSNLLINLAQTPSTTLYAMLFQDNTGLVWSYADKALQGNLDTGTHIPYVETPAASGVYVFEENFTTLTDGFYTLKSYTDGNTQAANDLHIYLVNGLVSTDALLGQIPLNHDTGGTDDLTYRASDGSPIVGAAVRVYTNADWASGSLANPVGATTTDTNGRWVSPIFVQPGTYTVLFQLGSKFGPDHVSITVNAAPPPMAPVAPGGGAPGDQPVPETVAIDHNTGGVDDLAYKDTNGVGIPGATVSVFTSADWASGNLTPVGTTTTDSNGRWVSAITVSRGTYVIQFQLDTRYGPNNVTITV